MIDLLHTMIKQLSELSHKEAGFISMAIDQAKNSPVLMRHGAVAIQNGKCIAQGCNNYRSHSSNGLMDGCTCHAECAVLHKLHKMKERSPSLTRRKITMYIVRIGQNCELRESAPCHDCHEKMLFFGIKRLVFTTEKQPDKIEVAEYNIETFKPCVITTGQRWVAKETA